MLFTDAHGSFVDIYLCDKYRCSQKCKNLFYFMHGCKKKRLWCKQIKEGLILSAKWIQVLQFPPSELSTSVYCVHRPTVWAAGLCGAVIRVFWTTRGELLCSGSRGCPIINPLPVSPTVQMVPGAHMASNPVIGILLSELHPTLLLLPPPPSEPHPALLRPPGKPASMVLTRGFVKEMIKLIIGSVISA